MESRWRLDTVELCCGARRSLFGLDRNRNGSTSSKLAAQETTCENPPHRQLVATGHTEAPYEVIRCKPCNCEGIASAFGWVVRYVFHPVRDSAECQLFRQLQTVRISGQMYADPAIDLGRKTNIQITGCS